jgi:cobalt-zinc-cadmium efflux system protein
VSAVEDLHIWGLSTSRTALTAHLVLENEIVEGADVIDAARNTLAALGIRKSTLQLETSHQHCSENR